MLRLVLFLIGLGGTALLAAEESRGRSTFPRQLFVASMAAGGSICGFAAAQTAFRMGRLARNRDALQPKEPTSSCLLAGWRMTAGAASFLVKASLGIASWVVLLEAFKAGIR